MRLLCRLLPVVMVLAVASASPSPPDLDERRREGETLIPQAEPGDPPDSSISERLSEVHSNDEGKDVDEGAPGQGLLRYFSVEYVLTQGMSETSSVFRIRAVTTPPIGFERLPDWAKRFRFPDLGRMNSTFFDEFTQTYWWE